MEEELMGREQCQGGRVSGVLVGWPCTSWIKGKRWARDGGQGKPPEGMNTEER